MYPELSLSCKAPILLQSDLFTPLTRTPWAGSAIADRIKAEVHPEYRGKKIGESWEFSPDPAFPSRVQACDLTLPQLIASCPESVLSERHCREVSRAAEILLKLICADEPLSFQIHPRDDDPSLAAEECGKPESWLILEAKPGSGIYLGFTEGTSKDAFAEALTQGDPDLLRFLQFVPVSAGDYFEIPPHVPHAIGGGITLFEPQRIHPGKSGKTYRLWDWNRSYNDAGVQDPKGKPRALHIREGLGLVKPEEQQGSAYVKGLQRQGSDAALARGLTCRSFPANAYYQVMRAFSSAETSKLRLEVEGGYAALVVLKGKVEWMPDMQGARSDAAAGEALLVPADAFPLQLAVGTHSDFLLVFPASCDPKIS